ncbi:MAG TPA: AMP-binding protein [Opitutaceae bacterium]|jgi:acyl-CoA synthetase (AMP-forming)/AMP-acid ligase II|nr:AMP-binding protein [Opitutaceae bacterium]
MTLLLRAWEATLRADPAAPALVDAAAGRVWSRRELDELAMAWAGRHGPAAAGKAVLFAEPNRPGWLGVFLGLLRAGAAAVPVEPAEPPAARRALAQAAGAAAIWVDGALRPVDFGRRAPRAIQLFKLTSGSSGKPRALGFTGAQLLADGRRICAAMGIRGRDLNLALIPFGHSYGLGNLVVPLLERGTAVLCGVDPLPEAIAAAAERWRPTVFPGVPALLRALAASGVAPGRLASLRTVISAGAPLAPEVAGEFRARFGRKIHNFYGSSETGGIAYDRGGEATLSGRAVGRPLSGIRLAFGRGHRFWVESTAVFTHGNRRRRRGRGAHRPADRGEKNSRGELVLLGRSGRMLKLAGRRLDPAEVERALRALPGVREAYVCADPARAESLAAAAASDRPVPEILAALEGRLAVWKRPRRLIALAEFPLSARGKPDYRRLRELLARR